MSMDAVRVGVVGDLEDDSAIVIDGETNGTGADIAVFRSEGEYYALDDLCTHQRASLAEVKRQEARQAELRRDQGPATDDGAGQRSPRR